VLLARRSPGSYERWPGFSAMAIAILILLLSPTPGLSCQMHFHIDTAASGSISCAGGTARVVGSDIEVDQVMGLGTPNDPDVACLLRGGKLDFQSGNSNVHYVTGGFHTGTFSVDPVPLPSALWLLGTGLIGLVGIRRTFRN